MNARAPYSRLIEIAQELTFDDELEQGVKEYFMAQAVCAARACTSLPKVGAVVVRDGRILSRGTRESNVVDGGFSRHAEHQAIKSAGQAGGADIYTTLEPCNYRNRGHGCPPQSCVEFIAEAGIYRVVIGLIDPNPRISGEGVRQLQARGVKTEFVSGLGQDIYDLTFGSID